MFKPDFPFYICRTEMAKAESAEISTEEKIRQAAHKVFTRKGYAATRTRDIAEEAGINLALLNYYFRSKEKLFAKIMTDSLQHFMTGIKAVLNDETTSLEEKIERIVINYTDMFMDEPDLPLFIMSEVRTDPDRLLTRMNIKDFIFSSHFMKQYQQYAKDHNKTPIHPIQFIMTIIGMTVFPFIASPLIQKLGDLNPKTFDNMLEERKTVLPKWIKAIMDSD